MEPDPISGLQREVRSAGGTCSTRKGGVFRQATMTAAFPRIVLTGFGKFNGVDDNPSTRIVEELNSKHEGFLRENRIVTEILEVSVQGCEEQLYAKYCSCSSSDNLHPTFIHLGVNGRIGGFNIESTGYNNMTFRCPDERAYAPQEQKIALEREFDEPLRSVFPVARIVGKIHAALEGQIKINETRPTAPAPAADEDIFAPSDNSSSTPPSCNVCDVSTDPGRFLCNYVYYRSLFHQHSNGLPLQSVFVHVPLEERISIPDQVKVVLLMLNMFIESSLQM